MSTLFRITRSLCCNYVVVIFFIYLPLGSPMKSVASGLSKTSFCFSFASFSSVTPPKLFRVCFIFSWVSCSSWMYHRSETLPLSFSHTPSLTHRRSSLVDKCNSISEGHGSDLCVCLWDWQLITGFFWNIGCCPVRVSEATPIASLLVFQEAMSLRSASGSRGRTNNITSTAVPSSPTSTTRPMEPPSPTNAVSDSAKSIAGCKDTVGLYTVLKIK